MNNVMEELITFDEEKDNDLIEFFGEDSVSVWDLIDSFRSLLAEKEELQRKLDEDYELKKIDPYEEFGISESDFH